MNKSAKGADNFTQCDSMLIGSKCSANTFPYIDVRNSESTLADCRLLRFVLQMVNLLGVWVDPLIRREYALVLVV